MSVEEFEHSEVNRFPAGGESVHHTRFFWEFIDKIGPPVFAAALVACLLSGRFEPLHTALLVAAFAMIAGSHWHTVHARSSASLSR
jgi:hypothetical protein